MLAAAANIRWVLLCIKGGVTPSICSRFLHVGISPHPTFYWFGALYVELSCLKTLTACTAAFTLPAVRSACCTTHYRLLAMSFSFCDLTYLVQLLTCLCSFVRSLLRAGVQPTLDPSAETFMSVQCSSPGRGGELVGVCGVCASCVGWRKG